MRPILLTAACLLLVLALYVTRFPFFELVELKTVDLRFRSRPVAHHSSEVVLAVIDEKSLDQEGRWPWPRSRMADLVQQLSHAGAKVIAFGVSFPEAEDGLRTSLFDQLRANLSPLANDPLRLENALAAVEKRFDGDRLLADAVNQSEARVVLGYFFQTGSPGKTYRPPEAETGDRVLAILPSRFPFVKFSSRDQVVQDLAVPKGLLPESN